MSFENETQVSRREYMAAEIGKPFTIDGFTGIVVSKRREPFRTDKHLLARYYVTLKMEDKCPKE